MLAKKVKFVLFALLLLLPSVYGAISISYDCYGSECAVGDFITWNLNFANDAEIGFLMKSISIINSMNETIAEKLGLDRQLEPGDEMVTSISSVVPKADGAGIVYYKPCFLVELSGSQENICAYETLELPVVADESECSFDSDCEQGYSCMDGMCVASGCGYCQYYLNGKCFEYECCKTSECGDDEICSDHRCELLVCEDLEYATGHECVSGCRPDEYLSNGHCVSLDCDYDEAPIDNICTKLRCADDEYASNHECKKLKCAPDEQAVDHSCVKLQCGDDEHVKDGECIKLECDDGEYSINHECRQLICANDEFVSNHECVKLHCAFDEKIDKHACVKLNCGILQKAVDHKCVGSGLAVFVILGLFLGAVIIVLVGFVISNLGRR